MHSYTSLDNLPDRCAGVLDAGRRAGSGFTRGMMGIDSAVLRGGGDAAIAAMLLATVMHGSATMPVVPITGRTRLPAFVGRNTLVIALSESGSDGPVVAAVGEAADLGASILVASQDGHLTDMARAQGYASVTIPPRLSPNAPVLAELFFAVWGLLAGLPTGSRLTPETAMADAEAAARLIARQRHAFGPEAAIDHNPARLLASALARKIPLLYGTSPAAVGACAVWADRLRRVGLPAIVGDLDRGASTEGWPGRQTAAPAPPTVEALILSDPTDQASEQITTLRTALGATTCNELSLDGHSAMERLWGAVYLAEWTAFYMTP
jgi:glucose/mannose-6-phosphate isomerase